MSAVGEVDAALRICRALRRRTLPVCPILLLISADQLGSLEQAERPFDDFCVAPTTPGELAARLRWRPGSEAEPATLSVAGISVEREFHQAVVAGETFTMTKKEHQLLRFLLSNPGKTFSRAQLLTEVWGHEFHFGGGRTVDVHVRRLRSKLGAEHARLIQTVRSVGYRFAPPA